MASVPIPFARMTSISEAVLLCILIGARYAEFDNVAKGGDDDNGSRDPMGGNGHTEDLEAAITSFLLQHVHVQKTWYYFTRRDGSRWRIFFSMNGRELSGPSESLACSLLLALVSSGGKTERAGVH